MKDFPRKQKNPNCADTLSGKGAFATCGQKASVSYKEILGGEEKKLEFVIGDSSSLSSLDKGVIGMAKGGKRIIYPPDDHNLEVELTDISPTLPDFTPFRIFGDMSEQGRIYKCGSVAKLNIKISDLNGKELFNSKDDNGSPVSFTIGKSEVFLGLEQGALGMEIGSKRTLLIPPDFQQTLNKTPPAVSFPLPKKQFVVVDIESVE